MMTLGTLLLVILILFILTFIYLLFQKERPRYTGYILKDMTPDAFEPRYKTNKALDYFRLKNLGKVVIFSPPDHYSKINPTLPPGGIDRVYYALCFQFPKDDFNIQKFDEWLEVSPVHSQYYQITLKQKEDLEAKIKQGLTSAAQAVADYELIKHDLRKYQEFMEYLKEKDEHSLKAIFVDQVDYHAGGGGEGAGRLSMSFMQQKNIMPTIVQDFYEMQSEEDLETNPRLKNLPTVEKNMLRTKWRAYKVWRDMFEREVKERYKRIKELVNSRKKSIEEYRNWLKPYITRHRILEEGFARSSIRKEESMFFGPRASATSVNGITIWAWKNLTLEELYRTPAELIAKANLKVKPNDEWTLKELVFDKEKGLVAEYKWITHKWVNDQLNYFYERGWLKRSEWYYTLYEIKVEKRVFRLSDGTEIEDAEFHFYSHLLSQNAMFVKLLELRAKQEEIDRYIDSLLGVKPEHEDIEEFILERIKKDMKKDDIVKEVVEEFDIDENDAKEIVERLSTETKGSRIRDFIDKFLDFFELPFMIFKKGPYETNISYRISKFYLAPMGSKLNTYKKLVMDASGFGK